MRFLPLSIAGMWCLIILAGFCAAQPPAAGRITHQPAATPAVVTERVPVRVVEEVAPAVVPAVVTTRPVVAEAALAPAGAATWWDAFGKMRYGFYDDGFTDDNWFYDYYEAPPTTVAVAQPVAAASGTRTSWRYEPQVEQRLFRW
jgi:hypothetical protein